MCLDSKWHLMFLGLVGLQSTRLDEDEDEDEDENDEDEESTALLVRP